ARGAQRRAGAGEADRSHGAVRERGAEDRFDYAASVVVLRSRAVPVIGLCLMLLGAGEGAEPPPDESDLTSLLSETVTSVASRAAESAQDAPATTWSISGTDLKRFGIQSVEEA